MKKSKFIGISFTFNCKRREQKVNPQKITCIRCQAQSQADREKTGAIPSTNLSSFNEICVIHNMIIDAKIKLS